MITAPQVLIDNQVTYKYIGTARSGALESSDEWTIVRLKLSGQEVTEIKWADGRQDPVHIWDDRASLVYK